MTTKLIGIKEFRANMAHYVRKAKKGDTRFIVMNRSKPFFEVRPLFEEDEGEIADALVRDLDAARRDARAGRVYTLDEVEAQLGL